MSRRRRGGTRRPALLAALLALASLLACTRAPVDAPEPGLPVPGGTLRIGIRELGSLDPQRAVDVGSLLLARSRYRGLTTLGPNGDTIEALAGAPEVTDRGRRYEYTLRADARFSDGRAITARDVVATFNRLVDRDTASPYASLLDAVEGFDEVRAGTTASLRGLIAPDARHLVIQLREPFTLLPTHLAHPALGILPPAAREGRFGVKSPASGPFLLRGLEEGVRAVLVRNARTARATAYLQRIELSVVSDGARSLRAGAVDAAFVATSDPSRLAPRWGLLSLGIDPQRIREVRLRRMIAASIDREAIVGSSEEPWTPIDRLVPLDPEPATGSAEPIEIDWPRTGALRFIHLDDAASRAFADGIVASAGARGIRIEAVPLAVGAYADALEEGGFDLVQLGWLSEVRSPDGFLARQLASDSPDNQLGYRSDTFDQMIARARATSDPQVREARYANAEAYALEAAVLVPVVQLGVGFDATDRVHGADLDGSGTFDAALAWIEADDQG